GIRDGHVTGVQTCALPILVLSMGLLCIYFRLVRHGERYQTITGKDYRPRRIDLGGWKYLACALSLLLVFFITGLPFLTMLYASRSEERRVGKDGRAERGAV